MYFRRAHPSWSLGLGILLAVILLQACSRSDIDSEKDVVRAQAGEGKTFCVENNQSRDSIALFVRGVAESYVDKQLELYSRNLPAGENWEVEITAYHGGEIKGEGKGKNEKLSLALKEATRDATEDDKFQKLDQQEVRGVQFVVTLSCPSAKSSSLVVETDGTGKELMKNVVIIRDMDKELIRQKIGQAKEYLLRMIDKEEHGAHKYYYALDDSFENRLHTIYTSSLIYTLLKIYDFDGDERLLQQAFDSGEFILFMQNMDEDSKRYGAFHYSYFLENKEREQRFVVGTASKTIFTLLELYKRTGDSKYLESATLAANWLLTMQRPDGSMTPAWERRENGKWYSSKSESILYNGQVLSALSRMHKMTGDERYSLAADKIAMRFTQQVDKDGCYIGDDFRSENPISSSWAIMSMLDYYQVSQDDYHKNMIFDCSDDLLKRQLRDKSDIFRYGRWERSFSTSGNGWINEVLGEVYEFCNEQSENDCDKYKDAMVLVTRWLIQNTYSDDNSFILKNPEMAKGGLYWNDGSRYVRTDSVCHGLNAYVGIIDNLEEGILVSVQNTKN